MPGRDPCHTLRELLATMHRLRAPGGCPWDAGQTPASLAPFILEEACEVVEAIETGDVAMVVDELGDLLLQIVFQAEIYSEQGHFDFADVAAGINAKLMRRHPHVFGTADTGTSSEELARQWERIKREEQAQPSPHPLGRLPGPLPALQRAQKLVARANRAGLDLERHFPIATAGPIQSEEALGHALMTLVKQAELRGLDAEQTMRRTVQKIFNALADAPGDKLQKNEKSPR